MPSARVKALAELKGREDFEPLAVAFKRVVNIIKGGVADPGRRGAVRGRLRGSPAAGSDSRPPAQVAEQVAAGDYPGALRTIAGLRAPVDAFFDGVMVMAKEEKVRENRLALLTGVAGCSRGSPIFPGSPPEPQEPRSSLTRSLRSLELTEDTKKAWKIFGPFGLDLNKKNEPGFLILTLCSQCAQATARSG